MPTKNFRAFYRGLDDALAGLYAPELVTLAADGEGDAPGVEFDSAVFERAAEWIHREGRFTPEMLSELPAREVIAETYRVLSRAVESGISVEMPEDLTAILQNNAFVFSGLKTYHSLSEVGLSLVGADGGIKPFADFHKDVAKIDEKYNRNYLYAEYNHAVTSSQMASKWHDFASDGERYDLQYRTAGDDHVREQHARLHNITLPSDDPFWAQFTPPNGWNCRCTVVQVRKGKYPASDSAESVAIGEAITADPKKQMFRFNPGTELKVFPDRHPYNKAPQAVKEAVSLHKVTKVDLNTLINDYDFAKAFRLVQDEEYKQKAVVLNDYEKAAIRHYSGDGFDKLNKYLRKVETYQGEQKNVLTAYTKVLDNALRKKQERFSGVVYRGTKLTDEQISVYKKALKSGKPVTENGFMSTAIKEENIFNGNVRYEIKCKSGVQIEELSKFKNETEVLFGNKTRFKVTKIEEMNNRTLIWMEEL